MASNSSLYFFVILFFIFVLIHKIVALVVILNLSINKIRYYCNIFEPLFILCFYLFFKLNTQIKLILAIFLIAPINYWLCDQGFIYNFIDNTPQNNKIVKKVSVYGDSVINIFVFSYVAYFIYSIFF